MSTTRNIQASFKTRNILCCETEIKHADADKYSCCNLCSGATCCLCGISALIGTGGIATPYAAACIALGTLSLTSAYRVQRDGRNAAIRLFEETHQPPAHQTMDNHSFNSTAPYFRLS